MRTGKNMSKRIVKLLIAVSVCMLLTGCVNTGAHIVPSVTMPPGYREDLANGLVAVGSVF